MTAKNRTLLQRRTSIANIAGKSGPKTAEGKRRSADNGRRNKGIKTSRDRAAAIEKRWGLRRDSFYSLAGCPTCTLSCKWPSFSERTRWSKLPRGCLERVLREDPARCFYHLFGQCCAGSGREGGVDSCILSDTFVTLTVKGEKIDLDDLREMTKRREVGKIKSRIESLKAVLLEGSGFTGVSESRVRTAIRRAQVLLRGTRPCMLETSDTLDEHGEILDLILGWTPPAG